VEKRLSTVERLVDATGTAEEKVAKKWMIRMDDDGADVAAPCAPAAPVRAAMRERIPRRTRSDDEVSCSSRVGEPWWSMYLR
jgi:hypothetical protein